MKRLFVVFALLICIALSTNLAAQELASLTGVVSDNTGAVIEGVAVKLVDTKTNASYDVKTNSVGAYTFVKLLPGPGYKLTFTKEGFEALTITNVYVGVGTHSQNAEMQIGKVTETVEVSGEAQAIALNTTDATVGSNFDMHTVHELPIENRDSPAALLTLQPGVATDAVRDTSGSRDGAITGARTDQTNVTLDGLDVNDFATGQAFATVGDAPVDSIQEFRAETANPLAASGRGSGGQIALVTKSGSNDWHGSLFEYHRNTVTEANNLFNAVAGVPTPKLIRNFFGGNIGGPAIKNKLFFFFNYQARRDAREDSVLATVPLDSFRDGNLSYIKNDPACNQFSRANSQPSCIGTVPNTGMGTTVTGLDPQHVGNDMSLLDFINSRYPHANDLTKGDGVNSGGFRFNAPVYRNSNDYVARVDYNLNDKMKVFGRVSFLRDSGGDDNNYAAPFQFPGDPITHSIVDHSYAYVFGHTWTISSTKVNNFVYGETRSDLNFPTTFNPLGTTFYPAFGPFEAPYSDPRAQKRIVPIPIFRDDFTYVRGQHNFQMGGTFKPIRTSSTNITDYNGVSIGLGGSVTGLNSSLRPSDLLLPSDLDSNGDPRDPSGVARNDWDAALPFILGRFANIASTFNNDSSLNQIPQGTGHTNNYRYYETEVYFQDTWRMRQDFTLTYGLRYQYYSVPYETNGLEVIPNLDLAQFYDPRVPLGMQGNFIDSPPNVTYNFGGKANHAPGMYNPDWKDFAPRLAFAYNPGSEHGFLGKLLGDRKTVIRGGAGVIFDHTTTSTLNFVQDLFSYVFQSSSDRPFPDSGSNSATTALMEDPRFTSINSIPDIAQPQPVTVPFQPFVDGGVADGTGQFAYNFAIDRNIKSPYSMAFSLGVQRELPGNFLVEANYFARLGRRLLARADAGQFVDFQDVFSPGHSLAGDFFDLTKQLRAGTDPSAVTAEPFFEDFFGNGATPLIAEFFQGLITNGDLTDTVVSLLGSSGFGLHGQFGSNVYYTNKSSSSYNGLLMSLHKRLSNNLQFDVNYTYSHSIDNSSSQANVGPFISGLSNFSGALICDITNLRKCRGNSDFDVTHIISGNFIYELPIGRGKTFGSTMPGWANQIVGGWQISGIPTWHTGYAFTTVSNAFPISWLNNAPATFDGDQSAIKNKIHFDPTTGFQLFADPSKAIAAFHGPLGLEGGSRNSFRGPSFTNLDLGVAKHFPIGERAVVEFRADAYNVFNHVNFGLPGTGGSGGTADITDPSSFGVLNTAGNPRQMQFALRLDF